MRPGYQRITERADVPRCARRLSPRTMILDVEPLLASWDSGQDVLDRGIALVLSDLAGVPGLQVVCFATNSTRRPSVVPRAGGMRVTYLAAAGKPLRIGAYRGFPRPGLVIGDQLATDGILARRLGYTFVLYDPWLDGVPAGPRLMGAWGRLVRPLLYTRAG